MRQLAHLSTSFMAGYTIARIVHAHYLTWIVALVLAVHCDVNASIAGTAGVD